MIKSVTGRAVHRRRRRQRQRHTTDRAWLHRLITKWAKKCYGHGLSQDHGVSLLQRYLLRVAVLVQLWRRPPAEYKHHLLITVSVALNPKPINLIWCCSSSPLLKYRKYPFYSDISGFLLNLFYQNGQPADWFGIITNFTYFWKSITIASCFVQ